MALSILSFPSKSFNSLTQQSQQKTTKSYRRLAKALLQDFEQWLRSRDVSEHTLRLYTRVVREFLNSLLSGELLKNEQATLAAYIDKLMMRGLSKPTIATHLTVLRRFFGHLHATGVIDRNPVLMLPQRRGYSRPLPKFLTEEEVSQLLDRTKHPRDKAILEFLYGSGCRVGELAALKVEDLNFKEHMVTLHGKGRKDRLVPIGSKAVQAVKSYLNGRTAGPVFVQRRFPDKAVSTRSLWRFVTQACLRAGLKQFHPHAFRHSFATHLLNRGCDVRYVQELLGHSWLATTTIYTHVALANLQATLRKYHPRG